MEKNHERFSKNNQGFSTIEAVASLSILALLLLITSSTLITSNSQANRSQQTIEDLTSDTYLRNYLSNPQFVGQLATYPENEDLRKCISNDGAFCDASKTYNLTVFDLYTKKPLNTTINNEADAPKKTLNFEFNPVCPNLVNECDSAAYINITITSNNRNVASTEENEIRTQSLSVKPINNNVLAMYPQSSLKKGGPVNIIFIIDTSNSMAYIKPTIKSGIEQVLEKLKENEINILVTSIASSWKNYDYTFHYVDGSGKEVPVTIDTPSSELNSNSIKQITTVSLNNSGLKSFKLNKSNTAAQRSTVLDNIDKHIEYLFKDSLTYPSSDIGLCYLALLVDAYKNKMTTLNTDPQVSNLIYVMTNENDESQYLQVGSDATASGWNWESCYKKISSPVKFVNQIGSTEYSRDYYATKSSAKITVGVNFLSDGVPATTTKSIYINALTAPGSGTFDCEANFSDIKYHQDNIKKELAYYYGSDISWDIKKCQRENSEGLFDYVYGKGSQSQNLCQTIYKPGGTGEKKFPYVSFDNCRFEDWEFTYSDSKYFAAETPYTETVIDSFNGTSMKDAIVKAINSAYPTGNYFLNLSIIPSSGVCLPSSFAEVGTKFEELYSELKSHSSISPVCEGKFNTDNINDGLEAIETIISNSISLSEIIAPKVTGVTMVKNGTSTKLNKTEDYSISSNQLVFKNGLIDSSTQLLIYYSY